MTEIGHLGEQFVAEWLTSQGWLILQERWRSRWGEIDLIVRSSRMEMLAFVEVKTRSQGNWDQNGQLAVNVSKQRKIYLTANLFLAQYPLLADLPCRFDVALVHYQKSNLATEKDSRLINLKIGQPFVTRGYQFVLKDYLESAFEV
jgi:putative endonuclease